MLQTCNLHVGLHVTCMLTCMLSGYFSQHACYMRVTSKIVFTEVHVQHACYMHEILLLHAMQCNVHELVCILYS